MLRGSFPDKDISFIDGECLNLQKSGTDEYVKRLEKEVCEVRMRLKLIEEVLGLKVASINPEKTTPRGRSRWILWWIGLQIKSLSKMKLYLLMAGICFLGEFHRQ